jgi:hypothetical protein
MLLLWGFYAFREKNYRKTAIVIAVCILTFLPAERLIPSQLQLNPYITARAQNLIAAIITISPESVGGQSHTTAWPRTLQLIFQNPAGFGFGTYSRDRLIAMQSAFSDQSASTNSFLEIALYGGLGALSFFIAILYFLARETRSFIRNKHTFSDLEFAWLIVGIAVLIDIFFTDAFLWRHTWVVLGIVLGLVLERSQRVPETIAAVGQR